MNNEEAVANASKALLDVVEARDMWRRAAYAWEQNAMGFMRQRDAARVELEAARAELARMKEGGK